MISNITTESTLLDKTSRETKFFSTKFIFIFIKTYFMHPSRRWYFLIRGLNISSIIFMIVFSYQSKIKLFFRVIFWKWPSIILFLYPSWSIIYTMSKCHNCNKMMSFTNNTYSMRLSIQPLSLYLHFIYFPVYLDFIRIFLKL